MKSSITVYIFFLLFSCKSQDKHSVVFSCGNETIELKLYEKVDLDEVFFEEGKTTTFITSDNVIIEYYCAENYLPHISDKGNYMDLSKNGQMSFGKEKKTGLYWREDNNLIYSNCKASDTAKYNRIFNDKVIKKH